MTFLNGLLALGTFAFAVPLVIHLLFRSRLRIVDWGAMHLLDGVIRINRRRLQWSNWLLLLLRCAIPILLAFCLARPVLTGFRALPGDSPQSWVLVVDDSRSMSARSPQDAGGPVTGSQGAGEPQSATTRIARARAGLASLLNEASRGDEVALIRTSQLDGPPGWQDVAGARRELRQLAAIGGPADLAKAVDVALQSAEDASHAERRIVVASDFQSRDLNDAWLAAADRLRRRREAIEPTPRVSFWNLGGDSERLENISLESVRLDAPAVVAGRPAEATARIRNASDRPASGLRVEWSLDGRPVDSQTLNLAARETSLSRASLVFPEAGVHEVAVTVEVADALAEDNARRLGVEVIEEVAVLLVDGDPDPAPLAGETDFLSIALSPYSFLGQPRPDVVRTRSIAAGELFGALTDGNFNLVMLANVRSLDPRSEAAVVGFVRRGGGLVVFDGELLDPDFYNRSWKTIADAAPPGGEPAEELSLPAELKRVRGRPRLAEGAVPGRVGELNPQFAAWAGLADGQGNPLEQIEVYAYRKLVARDPDSGAAPTVLLELANGDPLVVSRRVGKGRVVQFAIPGDADWSTLPLRPIFLPMIQQLVLELAGGRVAATIEVGEGIRVPLAEFGEEAELREDGTEVPVRYTVEPPGNVEVPIVPGPDQTLTYSATSRPGVYRFRRIVEAGAAPPTPKATLRVAEVPAAESQLRDSPADRLERVAERLGAASHQDFESLAAEESTHRYGREVWRWLWVAVLAAMIAEVIVSQTIRRRVSGVGAP